MPRRERATIAGEVLEALSRAAATEGRLSHVAQKVNLPYDRLREYVADLQARGVLDPADPFRLTPRGRELLEKYRAWRESLRLFGLAPRD